jgi:hypothetical protein
MNTVLYGLMNVLQPTIFLFFAVDTVFISSPCARAVRYVALEAIVPHVAAHSFVDLECYRIAFAWPAY